MFIKLIFNEHLFKKLIKELTSLFLYDKLILVDTEEYPSPAEGIGLENRQGC